VPRDVARFRAARSFGAAAFLSTLALPAGFASRLQLEPGAFGQISKIGAGCCAIRRSYV
jgi:hypothetical protein